MKRLITKYGGIIGIEWKNSFAYRGDLWLTTLFRFFSVLLAYLLWSAVYGGRATLSGMTLPQMVTYYLLTGALTPLTQGEGLLGDFSNDIRNGTYSKYLVRPVSPVFYYLSAGFARAILPFLASVGVLGLSYLIFGRFFAPLSAGGVAAALPILLIGALLNLLISYLISLTTFIFTDVGFIFVLQHLIYGLLSGSLIPLQLLFGSSFPVYSPFSYLVYYPVMLCLGRADVSPIRATAVLCCWTAVFLLAGLALQRRAARRFEGVGI